MRKAREGAASGEDLLSGTPEGIPSADYRPLPLQRPANSPPGLGLRHLIPLVPFLSLLPSLISFFFRFFLSRGEGGAPRTTCLLEKSARLPRALINLHSARGERGERGDSSRVTTRVTRINVADLNAGAVNLVNSCNACRGANGTF